MPPNANIAAFARSHDSCRVANVAATNLYLLSGRPATNTYNFEISTVAGSTSCIVGPDRSASTLRPALWPAREDAPVTLAQSL